MMLKLKTGQVPGYSEGQEPLIYLVTTCQDIENSGQEFVFSDGHGIAAWTKYFHDLAHLNRIDWAIVYERYWMDKSDDLDRQRRKQAEFLVHRFCPWGLIHKIGVIDQAAKERVDMILDGNPEKGRPVVTINRDWYYW